MRFAQDHVRDEYTDVHANHHAYLYAHHEPDQHTDHVTDQHTDHFTYTHFWGAQSQTCSCHAFFYIYFHNGCGSAQGHVQY